MKLHNLLLAICLAGCSGHSPVPSPRFTNAPPVAVVNDRLNVPKPPANRDFYHGLYQYEGVFERRITRGLELPRPQRARGTNAIDEVPDSTWFTNRIGIRDMSLDELRTGPVTIESPELHTPWTILSTKGVAKWGGMEPGFIITDARGIKFLLKFDSVGNLEMESAADVIVSKLMWACGYNVPEDFVVHFDRADLVLTPKSVIKKPLGDEPLDQGELARRLDSIEKMPDGRFRALATRWIPGVSLGGHPAEGVRPDDPNDRIPHQLRRDLRGLYAFFSWVDHTDVHEGNFLDVWVADPRDPRRHYVEHYMIDFGKALGGMAKAAMDPRRGHEYRVDFVASTQALMTFGAVKRPWEGRTAPSLRGVGLFEAGSYDPSAWKPQFPTYLPLVTADRVDKLWASKILMRFTRAQLRAIVEMARLSDPRAVDYITDTLVTRQRATAYHWFSQTSPLDRWTVRASGTGGATLCFDDLLISYQLAPVAPSTRYVISGYNRAAKPIGLRQQIGASARGRTCAPFVLAPGEDAYTIVRIVTQRPGFSGATFVHVDRDPRSATPRVIGIWRQ